MMFKFTRRLTGGKAATFRIEFHATPYHMEEAIAEYAIGMAKVQHQPITEIFPMSRASIEKAVREAHYNHGAFPPDTNPGRDWNAAIELARDSLRRAYGDDIYERHQA